MSDEKAPEIEAPKNPFRGARGQNTTASREAKRAAERAQERTETRGPAAEAPAERLYRTKRHTADHLYIDPRMVPNGMTYEWKRESVYGEPDPDNMLDAQENHWKPVDGARHPNLAGGKKGPIKKKGLILCERPKYLTDEAKQEQYDEARAQLMGTRQLINSTPANTFTRNHQSAQAVSKINTSYSPVDFIPDE